MQYLKYLSALGFVLLGALGIYLIQNSPRVVINVPADNDPIVVEPNLGRMESNNIEGLKNKATTTGSYCATCPVKLLDKDLGRKYAIISNPSDTAIYLYPTSTTIGYNFLGTATDSGQNATSTIKSPLSGILVPANGQYELDADNLVTGEVWASSTAVSKQINVSYSDQ